jgi:serine/threonine protein kinase
MQKLDDKNVQKMLDLFHDSKNNQLLMVLEYIPDNLKKVMKRK